MCVHFPFLGGSFLESDLSSAVLLVTSHVSETQHRRLGEVKWSQSAELPDGRVLGPPAPAVAIAILRGNPSEKPVGPRLSASGEPPSSASISALPGDLGRASAVFVCREYLE